MCFPFIGITYELNMTQLVHPLPPLLPLVYQMLTKFNFLPNFLSSLFYQPNHLDIFFSGMPGKPVLELHPPRSSQEYLPYEVINMSCRSDSSNEKKLENCRNIIQVIITQAVKS